MPYKSEAQRKYFNANREKLEAEGVDVDEWNESSKGKKLPEKAEKKSYVMPQQATPDGTSVGVNVPFDSEVFKLLQGLNSRLPLGGQLSSQDKKKLQKAYGWEHEPDELDLVEGLMEMEEAEKKAFTPDTSFADGYDEKQLREALAERVRMIAQLRAHRDALLDDKSGYKQAKDPTYPLIGMGLGGALGAAGYYLEPDEDKEDGNLIDRMLLPATVGGLAGLGVKAFAERGKGRLKTASYSVIQNMAWMSAQEKTAHEKQANKFKSFLKAVTPFLKGQAAQTAGGAAIGAATSPFTANAAGVETGAGRMSHLMSSMAVGGSLGNPAVRKNLFSRKPFTAKGQQKLQHEAMRAFARENPTLSGKNLVNAFNKANKGLPQKTFAPVKGTLLASSLAGAPTVIGAYTDPTKRFAEKVNEAVQQSEAGKDFKSPSAFFANIGKNLAEDYGFDKAWVENVGKELAIQGGSGLGGGILGSLIGGKLADMAGDVAIDTGNADYKNLDEESYKKRRRKEKLKTLLYHAGSIGGGFAGSALGAVYLPDLLRKHFNVKKGSDMNMEIRELARLVAQEKQAGIGLKPEVKKRLMGGGMGGLVGAGIGAVGTAALDPVMDKLFKSPEEQMREKARTSFMERLKARLIAGAAVGGGIGIARGSGMKDMFQKT